MVDSGTADRRQIHSKRSTHNWRKCNCVAIKCCNKQAKHQILSCRKTRARQADRPERQQTTTQGGRQTDHLIGRLTGWPTMLLHWATACPNNRLIDTLIQRHKHMHKDIPSYIAAYHMDGVPFKPTNQETRRHRYYRQQQLKYLLRI